MLIEQTTNQQKTNQQTNETTNTRKTNQQRRKPKTQNPKPKTQNPKPVTIQTKTTNSSNQDFINLVKELDAFLTIVNGESDDFFRQFNNLEDLKHIIVMYSGETPIGCGALKQYNAKTVEVKRMYVRKEHQGKNLGVMILNALEIWAKESGNTRCILETGTMLPEAIRFYEKHNYQRIPNYDQYIGVEESVCFEKKLI